MAGGAAVVVAGLVPVAGCGSQGPGAPQITRWVRVSTAGLATDQPAWVEFELPAIPTPVARGSSPGAGSGAAGEPSLAEPGAENAAGEQAMASPIPLEPGATPDITLRAAHGAAWLVLGSSGDVVAFDPHCTHARCLYDWTAADERFACRCHRGFFSVDGAVLGGPPPRPLDRLATRPAGGDAIEIAWPG